MSQLGSLNPEPRQGNYEWLQAAMEEWARAYARELSKKVCSCPCGGKPLISGSTGLRQEGKIFLKDSSPPLAKKKGKRKFKTEEDHE